MTKIAVILLAASVGLLVYTFYSKSAVLEMPQSVETVATAASVSRVDAKYMAYMKEQAPERNKLFDVAVQSEKPTVASVLLPLVEEVHCRALVRVGSVGDGGKWMCNPWALPKDGVIFSLGSNNDISFEAEFQKITNRAAKIITVDMNAAAGRILQELAKINGEFVHAKITNETNLDETPPHYTVQDLMKKMNRAHIEILKMDIEGAEFTVLPQFLESNSVCQIMVEIHNIKYTAQLLRQIAKAGFWLQRYELNAYWTGSGLCEYSFLHESCIDKYGAVRLARFLKE